jgi:hypothetical protein
MTATDTKAKKERVVHSAREKAQAVLAWWTERRRPSEICRDLKITSNLLMNWQERAMEGILAALEPRTRLPEDQKPALPTRVERLLARKTAPETTTRLSRRLTALVQSKETEKPAASGTNR